MRTQKSYRMFDGKRFDFADWKPTKAQAQAVRRKWGDKLGANVRVVKMKYGYNVYVRT